MTPATLDDLLARLAEGDRTAADPAFELLWPRVQAYCLKLGRARAGLSEADAADAAQNALLKIYERVAEYDPTQPAWPWVLAIAYWETRSVIQNRRRQGRWLAAAPGGAADGSRDSPGDPLADVKAQADDEPEAAVARHEAIDAALEVLGGLSPTDRAALWAAIDGDGDSAGGAASAAERKRRQRAWDRLRLAWRRSYGA